jgi:hypothetical protein
MQIEGRPVPKFFLQVDKQQEVGEAAFDKGAEQLSAFFQTQLQKFLASGLDKTGREIIECCLSGGRVAQYEQFLGGVDV